MSRIISPALDQINNLRQPLTQGEMKVLDFFVRKLPDWHIFIQPHLNGLRPDFVLLNPKVSIGVFEIKDWDLDAIEYYIDEKSDYPKLMGKKSGEVFSKQNDNPIEKICMYKEEIFHLYCPRLDKKAGLAVITAGVIFPFADDDRIKRLFEPYINYLGINNTPKLRYYPISGKNSLDSENINSIFPASRYKTSSYMNEEIAKDLMIWLIEPDVSAEQRDKLSLDEKQKKFVVTRTKSGYRRIRGPAGSGKSLVLAARAAQLAYDKKDVIVLTYNITLINYLGDLVVRWPYPGAISRKNLTLISFFDWCKIFCSQMGYRQEYKNIWKNHFENDGKIDEDELWNFINADIENLDRPLEKVVRLVASILEDDKNNIYYYDAVLVDEGQFFLPEWWNLLRKICKNNGEMLLVADKTQDIYNKARSWTDSVMENSGFRHGRWGEFRETYRIPPKLIAYANKFAEEFLPKELIDLPDFRQLNLDLFPCKLRWIQTTKNKANEAIHNEIVSLMKSDNELAMPDIIFLSSNKKVGFQVVDALKSKNINCLHTFSSDGRENRRQKHGFYKGDSRIKATTIHSFVGWEARALVLYIGEGANKSLIYSGLTRLKRHENMSFLTVICSVPELEVFGQTWQDFAMF
jgi:hypothetical protein